MRAHRDPGRRGDGNTLVAPRPAATVIVTYEHVPLSITLELWNLYRNTFTEVRSLAAQEHLMDPEAFGEVMADRRIRKFVAVNDAKAVGLSVMTDDLKAWPLVSPAFFERKYPGRRIFYVGFVAVPPRQQGVFVGLIDRMYRDVIAADGIAVMDFCDFNVEQKRLHLVTARLLGSKNPNMRHETIGYQQWDAYDFRAPTDTAPNPGGAQ